MENRTITVNVVTPLLKGLVTLHVIYAAMIHDFTASTPGCLDGPE